MSNLTTSPPRAPRSTARRSRAAQARLRRGYVSLLSIMIIMIGIVTLMLVVNWTYLVLASRQTLRLSDTLALSAVSDLLDEEVLEDTHAFPSSQADDLVAASDAIKNPGTGFLDRNNASVGPSLRPTAAQVTVTGVRVDDASLPAIGGNVTLTPAAGEPYNSLLVEIFRDSNSANPVELIFRGQGSPDTAKISGAALATLDSRVVGFRPQPSVFAPVAPLAIDSNAWFNDRPAATDDSGLPDQRFELDFTLQSTGNLGVANAALVSLHELAGLNTGNVADQVSDGIGPADVNGTLGPLTSADPLPLAATQTTPAGDMTDIAAAFNAVAASNNPRRAFPIYAGGFSDPLNIVGFVGARIIDADADDVGDGPRLRVRLQPDFIVHGTIETLRTHPGATSVPENPYIHKIRLTR